VESVEVEYDRTFSILAGSGRIPEDETTWPKYGTSTEGSLDADEPAEGISKFALGVVLGETLAQCSGQLEGAHTSTM